MTTPDEIINTLTSCVNFNEVMFEKLLVGNEAKEPLDVRTEKAINMLTKLNLTNEILGVGAFRTTIKVGNFAVKIATHKQGFTDLEQEFLLFKSLPRPYSKYFAKCFCTRNGVGVFELAPKISHEDFNKYEDTAGTILDKLSRVLNVGDIQSNHRKNWGLKNSELVIVDYAEFSVKNIFN